MSVGRRVALVAVALAAVALVATPAVQAKAKRVMKQAVKTFCTDTSVRIPDGPEFGDYVSESASTGKTCPKGIVCGYGGLPLGAVVLDVEAGIRVSHPSAGDLSVLLVSPVGTLATLTGQGNGGGGDDFGAGGTGCDAAFTSFDDQAAVPIRGATAAQAPFAGAFRPHLPLAANVGTFGAGDWRFFFDDTVPGNVGVVEAVSLRLSYKYVVRKKKKRKS
ncbi:MAG: proprotein convertase P-domain-containing protein [Actinomycetota bacterium]|nr:proprotein convertase P-domain-containing protein [Actinomycetota bacterium]